MKHTTSQHLFAYWNEVRQGRPAPRRFDIEPARISHILAETLILERVDFETYRFRLAGTRICQQFGRELRGSDFFTLWDNEADRAQLEHDLSRITHQFKVVVIEFEAFAEFGRPSASNASSDHRASETGAPQNSRPKLTATTQSRPPHAERGAPLRFEMILLPLVHTRGTVDRCLGAISRAYGPEIAADTPLVGHRLISTKLISPFAPGDTPFPEVETPTQQPLVTGVRSARIVRSERRQFRVYDGGLSDPGSDKHER